jgi:hypothetical protein
MRKIFLFVAVVLFVFAFALIVQAQEKDEFLAPADSVLYGIYQDGTAFVAKKLVDEAEGNKPKFRSGLTGWADKEMNLSADKKYYFCKLGIKFPLDLSKKYVFCFSVGGDKYIPGVLYSRMRSEEIAGVREEDIVSNGQPDGYNFEVRPISVPKK